MKKILILILFVCLLTTSVPRTTALVSSTDTNAENSLGIAKATRLTLKDLSTTTQYRIRLSWSPSRTSSIDGYSIYRQDGSQAESLKISSVASNASHFDDTSSFTADQVYIYAVRAYQGDNESINSNAVSISPSELSAYGIDNFKPLVVLSSLNNINDVPVSPVLILSFLFLLMFAGLIFLYRGWLAKKFPILYKDIIQTKPTSQAGHFFSILFGIFVLIIILAILIVIYQEGFSIFIG